MSRQIDLKLDKKALVRALVPILKSYQSRLSLGEDIGEVRSDLFELNETLAGVLSKSAYVRKHLDWYYTLELLYYVLDENAYGDVGGFVDRLEYAIRNTADSRDYIAIFPVGFGEKFGVAFAKKSPYPRGLVKCSDLLFTGERPNVRKLNSFLRSKYGCAPISDSDYLHLDRTTHGVLAAQPLVTFLAHGAEDALRFSAARKFAVFTRVFELFAVLYGKKLDSFSRVAQVNHFVLVNRVSGDVRRFPAFKSSSLPAVLDEALVGEIRKPIFGKFVAFTENMSGNMASKLNNAKTRVRVHFPLAGGCRGSSDRTHSPRIGRWFGG